MKKPKRVPLIEILECKSGIFDTKGKARYKGQLLDTDVMSICDYEYLELKMPARTAFDFVARKLPQIMCFGVLMENGECIGLLQDVHLYRMPGYVRLSFHIIIDERTPPKSDLNPYVAFSSLLDKLKLEQYNLTIYADEYNFAVVFKIPLTDNVYPHYQKHLAALEKICRTIENDMIKRLNKKAGK